LRNAVTRRKIGAVLHAGGLSIRLRSTSIVALFLLTPAIPLAASAQPVVLLLESGRREVAPVVRGGAELIPLDQVVQAVGGGLAVSGDPRGISVKLTYEGREVVLYDGKSLASVGGDLRLLSSPALFEGGRWLVPVDTLPRVLGPLLGTRVDWRAASRVLVIGEVAAPKIDVKTFVSGDLVRVVLEASEAVPFRVLQEEGRVTVTIPRDLVSVAFQQQRLTGGIVDGVQFLGGRENVFAVSLGRRFQRMTASEQAAPARLVMEFQAAPLTVASPPPGDVPGAGFRPAAPADRGGIRTVVIDPGHGGAEVGAQGPGGTLEKDVTLAIGRKVRSALANNLGLQAFLTRDKDHEVALDDRTAFANNYKADLFVSIHANASAARGARGSEVYFLSYQASDEESRRLAQSEGGAIVPGTAFGGTSDLALILWDMAQAEHLEESSALATRINEELAEVTGSQGRGIKQAPFRVLVGAGMPAVLVEIAFISNADEEKLLTSDAYQSKVAAALVKGIARYHHERGQAVASTPARPGS
jgi:N-acetylmuramoyl-L-alanine amidase